MIMVMARRKKRQRSVLYLESLVDSDLLGRQVIEPLNRRLKEPILFPPVFFLTMLPSSVIEVRIVFPYHYVITGEGDKLQDFKYGTGGIWR